MVKYDERSFGPPADAQPGQCVDAPADDLAIGRHPVIGQTIPGREGQRLDVGMKKREGGGKARHPPVVAADMQPASRVPLGDEPADDRRVVPLGRAEQSDARAAARQAQQAEFAERLRHVAGGAQRKASSRRITSWSCAAGGGCAAADPIEQIGVGAFEQRLVAVELGHVEPGEMGLGKAAENQVALARAAVPGPEQQALAADVGEGCHGALLAVTPQGYRDPFSRCQPRSMRT